FSSQSVRCTKCGAKYRRIPLRGRCLECSGNLTLTVHESSVKKYLEISKRISQQFEVSNYLRQRIDLIEDAITSLFTNDKTQDRKSTRLNSSHVAISYAVFCLKKKNNKRRRSERAGQADSVRDHAGSEWR